MGEKAMDETLEAHRRKLDRWLSIVLVVTALDAAYLSWRFSALFAGWVTPGTGLCSWTEWIDCDKVLQTPQARAFVVPNAVLGLGFYTGAMVWWLVGGRLGPSVRSFLLASLVFWFALASAMTLWFWRLMFQLDAVCPFCPWNHVLTYVALALSWAIWRATPPAAQKLPPRSILVLSGVCIVWFWAWQGAWLLAEATVLR